MHCSSVLEFYFSYLTCSVSPAAPGNYGVELLRSPDPLLECTFSSTHQSPSAHYLWSLDDIAQSACQIVTLVQLNSHCMTFWTTDESCKKWYFHYGV